MARSHVAGAVQVAGSFMAVLSFGIVLDLPKKYLDWLGVTGGVCQLVYLSIREGAGSLIFAAFLSGLSVALLGYILARIPRASVSVFLIPGILPPVPGISAYNCIYNIIRNSQEQSTCYLIKTVQVAGTIAVTVFLMDSMSRMIKNRDKDKA